MNTPVTVLRTVSRYSVIVETVCLTAYTVRFALKDLEKDYEKTEDDIKAVQSVGQIIGEVMKQLDDDRCESTSACAPSASD